MLTRQICDACDTWASKTKQMMNFWRFWPAQNLKTIRFKIFTLEIKWIIYFFLAYLKILIVSLQSILKTRKFFSKKVSFERIVERDFVFSLLIFASHFSQFIILQEKRERWSYFLWESISKHFLEKFLAIEFLIFSFFMRQCNAWSEHSSEKRGFWST